MPCKFFPCSGAFKISLNVVGTFFVIFILFDLLLVYVLFKPGQHSPLALYNKKLHSSLHVYLPNLYTEILHKHFRLVNEEWRLSAFLNRHESDLNCSSLTKLKQLDFLATGWTKASYRIKLEKKIMILKTVNVKGHDVSTCLAHGQSLLWNCYINAATKILNEIINLKQFPHENIIKVLGYCIPEKPKIDGDNKLTVSVITEYGEPLHVIKLLQMSWENRLRISLGLARLFKYLSEVSLGPVSINDFRRQQFVIVEGELKLVDVDDLGIGDPACNTQACCIKQDTAQSKICVSCINNICNGYNEKLNIKSASKHFINYILPHGVPLKLTSYVDEIVQAYDAVLWNASKILKKTEHLSHLFIRGFYRNSTAISYLSDYTSVQNKDLSGLYDYHCKLTVSGYGCSLSVFDAEEAALLCSSDLNCKAFVLTNITTWTGRKIVHFKNGVGRHLQNNNTVLYIKL